ncbi:MAG: hypothetical protein EZS28_019166 [Streblomastix strix]|uniref:Uncharacterized protein n=1 Tax=Streblomastix strix TaxID=222440 RepID=A0A5J4VRQ8_9EUKA|nr:MAG: hypothetical protein EZS28_019166 [Streblomastix strix]
MQTTQKSQNLSTIPESYPNNKASFNRQIVVESPKKRANSAKKQKTPEKQEQYISSLTHTLVSTILNDFDAAKSMNEDMEKIMPLQISPYVLSNYQFNSHASMRRLLKYGTDLNILPPRMRAEEEKKQQRRYADAGQNPQNQRPASAVQKGQKTSALQAFLEDGVEPVNFDSDFRKKMQDKLIAERKTQQGINSEDQEISQTASQQAVTATQSSDSSTEGKDNNFEDQHKQQDKKGKEKDDLKLEDGGNDQKGEQNNLLKLAARSAGGRGAMQPPSGKQTSVFASLFSDPNRGVRRAVFSPFSSKKVPFIEEKMGISKKGKSGSGGGISGIQVPSYLPPDYEEDDDEFEDEDDQVLADPEFQSIAKRHAKRRATKRQEIEDKILDDERESRWQAKIKNAQATGKTIDPQSYKGGVRSGKDGYFGKTGSGNQKRAQTAAGGLRLTGRRGKGISQTAVTANLYVSPVRQKIENILMGGIPQQDGVTLEDDSYSNFGGTWENQSQFDNINNMEQSQNAESMQNSPPIDQEQMNKTRPQTSQGVYRKRNTFFSDTQTHDVNRKDKDGKELDTNEQPRPKSAQTQNAKNDNGGFSDNEEANTTVEGTVTYGVITRPTSNIPTGSMRLGATGLTQDIDVIPPAKRRPLMVTRTLEPSNVRALDHVPFQRVVEDAELQKYVHMGIASPSCSVVEYQKFMVQTKDEFENADQMLSNAKDEKRKDVLKMFAEKNTSDLKYSRRVPAPNKMTLEVRKPLISGDIQLENQ